MGIGTERYFADSPQQFTERRIPVKAGAQGHHIGEEANGARCFGPGAVGHGRAHQNILLSRVAVQECLECRQQRHEPSNPVAARERAKFVAQGSRQLPALHAAPKDRSGGARVVEGKGQSCRDVVQLLLPVFELILAYFVDKGLPLPHREVCILHGRFGEIGGNSRGKSVVGCGQFFQQHRDRRPITDDVVQREHQDVLAIVQAEQGGTNYRAGSQVERASDFLPKLALEFGLTFWHRPTTQVDHREIE